MRRRSFIIAGFFTLLGGYTGGWWLFKVRRRDASDFIIATLRRRLAYLRLEEEGLVQFARDFQEGLSARRRRRAAWAGMLGLAQVHANLLSLLPGTSGLRQFENEIVTAFLLASDFFFNGADESRPLRYIGLLDPYRRPCANPFARFTARDASLHSPDG